MNVLLFVGVGAVALLSVNMLVEKRAGFQQKVQSFVDQGRDTVAKVRTGPRPLVSRVQQLQDLDINRRVKFEAERGQGELGQDTLRIKLQGAEEIPTTLYRELPK